MSPQVPVIDIAAYLSGADPAATPAEIDRAATTSGFFQVVGHGVDIALLDADHAGRGGVPERYADFFAPNAWPDLDGFRAAVTALFTETRQPGGELMRLFAPALDLPAGYFDPWLEPDSSSCSINYYPARHAPLETDPTVIFDEHFDGGTLTILHQRGTYDGLQIRTLDGDWFNVPIVPEAFVINMGELMTRWTNDRRPATRHRVVAAADPDGHRTTLTTFHLPSVQAPIVPLPSCGGVENPRYGPVTPYEGESRFIRKTYAERRYTVPDPATDGYLAALDASK